MPPSYLRTPFNPLTKKSGRQSHNKSSQIHQPNGSRSNRQRKLSDPFDGQYQCNPFAIITQGATEEEVEDDMAAIYAGIAAVNARQPIPTYVAGAKRTEKAERGRAKEIVEREDDEDEGDDEDEDEEDEEEGEEEESDDESEEADIAMPASPDSREGPSSRTRKRAVRIQVNADADAGGPRYRTRASVLANTDDTPIQARSSTRATTKVDVDGPNSNPLTAAMAETSILEPSRPKACDTKQTESKRNPKKAPIPSPRMTKKRKAAPKTPTLEDEDNEMLESIRLADYPPKANSELSSPLAKKPKLENDAVGLDDKNTKRLAQRHLLDYFGSRRSGTK